MKEQPFTYTVMNEPKTITPEIKALLDIAQRSQNDWEKAMGALRLDVKAKQAKEYFLLSLADMMATMDNVENINVCEGILELRQSRARWSQWARK